MHTEKVMPKFSRYTKYLLLKKNTHECGDTFAGQHADAVICGVSESNEAYVLVKEKEEIEEKPDLKRVDVYQQSYGYPNVSEPSDASVLVKEEREEVKQHISTMNGYQKSYGDQNGDSSIIIKVEEQDEEELCRISADTEYMQFSSCDDSMTCNLDSGYNGNNSMKDGPSFHDSFNHFDAKSDTKQDMQYYHCSRSKNDCDSRLRDEECSTSDVEQILAAMEEQGTEDLDNAESENTKLSGAENSTEREVHTCVVGRFPFDNQGKISSNATSNHTCNVCSKKFTRSRDLTRHLKTHQNAAAKCSCDECSQTFTKSDTPSQHNLEDISYCCSVCNKGFTCKSQLTLHMKSHTGWSCPQCEKIFKHKSSLKLHLHLHTGTRVFSCDVCQKTFTHKRYLERHKATHTGEKLHKCELCEKRYTRKEDVKRHILTTHSGGEKPYRCNYENCSKTFTEKGSLKKHFRLHTGEKPFSCPLCNKTFAQSSNCKIHMTRCSLKLS